MTRAARPAPIPVVETEELVDLPGGPLPLTLRRSPRARGLRVTIHPERGVVVSVPHAGRRGWADPMPHVTGFLRQRETWVRRHLARQAAERARRDARPALADGRAIPFRGIPHRVRVAYAATSARSSVLPSAGPDGPSLRVELAARDRRPLERVLTDWLRERAREDLDAALARHADALGRPTAVTLRDPRSRWGSCSRAGRLSFSWRLVLAPPEALETVAVHELCHLRVFGHGPRFRALLASRVPDHARWRRWLHDHASELHAALDPAPADRAA